MSQFKLVVRQRSHELINTVTGHKDRTAYSHPTFVDNYMYLSPYWGDDLAGVYEIKRIVTENEMEIEDISLKE